MPADRPETWPVCICGHSRTRHTWRVMPGCVSIYGECLGFGPDFKRCGCPTYCHDDAPPAPAASAVTRAEREVVEARDAERTENETLRRLLFRAVDILEDEGFTVFPDEVRSTLAALRGKE